MFCRPGDTVRFLAFAQIASSGLGKSGITVTIAVNEGTTNKITAASATAMTAVDATNQPGLYYYDYTVTSTFFGSIVGQATTTDTTCIVRSLEMLYQAVAWLLTCASGTASAGAAGSITLAGASATDSLYNGETVQIISGTGAGQARTIIGYVGSTKVATVGRNWAVTPDSTSVFSVIPGAHPRVDDNLAVIMQSGTGTGQISLSAGAVTAGTVSDKTGYSLSQSFPTNFASLGISVAGKINGVVLADTVTTYTGDTPQTGDAYARIGAAGSGLVSLGDARIANLDATVSSRMATYTQPTGFLGLNFGTLALQSQIPANFTAGTFSAAGVFATAALANAPTGGGGGGGLDAAGTRAALGMAAANLDTQLAAIKAVDDSIKAVTDKLDTALIIDGAVYKYTVNALENAPAGGGGGGVDQWTKTKAELLAYGQDTAGYGQAMLLLSPNVPVTVTPAGDSTRTPMDIIDGALRLLQVLGEGTILEAGEANDALEALNLMLDSWSNDSLTIWHVTQEVFQTNAGHNPHTWGAGGDFNSVRPTRILGAKVRITNVPTPVDIPLDVIGFDDYAAISAKSISTAYPNYLYIDNEYPNANVYLWPVPDGTSSLVIYSEKPHLSSVLLTTQLSMPPGYFRALKYNLACDLAPEYQITAGPDIQRIAIQALASIKRKNWRPETLTVDPATLPGGHGKRFNIYSGI